MLVLLSNVFRAVRQIEGERKSLKAVLMNSTFFWGDFQSLSVCEGAQPRKRVSTVKGIFSSLIHAPSTFFYPSLQSLKGRDKTPYLFFSRIRILTYISLLPCAILRGQVKGGRFAKKALQVPNLTLGKHPG